MAKLQLAPCGHGYRFDKITRTLHGVLWPTAFIECRCTECNAVWTERYEFDFSIAHADPHPTNQRKDVRL